MPKASIDINPIDPRVLAAARRLADEVVQPAIEAWSKQLGAAWNERPDVVAAALSETLYREVLRWDTTRWLCVAAEQAPNTMLTETRAEIGRLSGYTRPGLERRLGLTGRVRRGRHNWTPRDLRDQVIVEHAQRQADEDHAVGHEEGRAEGP